ncbi:MAG: YkgJ family cysteine cluster protein [Blastocatellia bacterium]|jgi:Fe-S-cluster containining protein
MAKKDLPVLATGKAKPQYDCSKCPGYCCTYEWILVTKRDITRLARRFDLTYETAERRFTRYVPQYGHRVLRHREDTIYKSVCRFFDRELRQCTVYEHRPTLCRTYPEENHCGFYDFLMWERKHQDDETFIPFQK